MWFDVSTASTIPQKRVFRAQGSRRTPRGFQPFQVPWLYKITDSNGVLCACALSAEQSESNYHLLSI
jgi:hypothetical protein